MIYINGRFLTQKVTGIQRFAIEVVKKMDDMIENDITILCPSVNLVTNLELKHIKLLKIGKLKGHMWEQISLPLYVKKYKGKLLNLGILGPIIYPGYVVMHDISFKTNSKHLDWKFCLWYKFVTKLNIKRYNHVFTVSNFSKKEILENYNISEKKITVVPNSANHMYDIFPDNNILKKYNLKKNSYYFSLGSNSLHKNFQYIYELAKRYPSEKFVVTGNNNTKVFGNNLNKSLDNLIYTGYLKDDELASLYSNCKAFIFPSLYEGFGIPPLEAVIMGCKHLILSNIDVLREVYGDNAVYADTLKEFRLPEKMVEVKTDELIKKYSWDIAARLILEKISK